MATNYNKAIALAAHIDDVDESPYELVKQLHVAGLIAPETSGAYMVQIWVDEAQEWQWWNRISHFELEPALRVARAINGIPGREFRARVVSSQIATEWEVVE